MSNIVQNNNVSDMKGQENMNSRANVVGFYLKKIKLFFVEIVPFDATA